MWLSQSGARRLAAVLFLSLGVAALSGPAGAQTASGGLAGRIVDEKKAALSGVSVAATDRATGFSRVTATEKDGAFRLSGLPVGVYTVVAELAGYATVTVAEVKVSVATERALEIAMTPAKVAETITVVDEAPLVQTTPAVGAVVSQRELENLPLNGRQFANLATLAPGTTLSVNGDPTKPGQQVVALNGGTGRNVNYVIDGGDNTDDTIGGALQNFNLEAVQEFKIQTQQYKAEYGRTTGGVLSVVTKSGTNTFAGSAYGFFRDKSLNSETETEKESGSGKQDYRREQYGASVGGPIVKDKLHFFATWEKTDRNTNYIVNTVLLPGLPPVLPDVQGKAVATPFTDELGTAKLSYDISAKQYLQVRYGYQKNSDKYGANPLADPSSLGTVANDYKSLLVGHTWQVGTAALNEALFQYTKFQNSITADSTLPSILTPSGVTVGQNGNTPQATHQTKYQYKDDFSWSQTLGGQRHDFKVGVNYVDEPQLEAEFTTGTSGIFTLLEDSLSSPVQDITFFGGFAGEKTPIRQYSGYAQDDWAATNRLTVNVGLRYDLWDGFALDQRSNAIWKVLSTQTAYGESYLRDFQGGKGGVLSNDRKDFAPRLGFTWDVTGNGRQLLRGGWGISYDFPYTNATILFPSFAVQSSYGVAYNNSDPAGIKNPDGTFFRPGQPLPPNQITSGGSFPPNDIASPTLSTPRSTQASLGYSWQVNEHLGLNFEGVSIRYSHLPFAFRANPFVDANGNGIIDPDEVRRFPQFGNFSIWYGKGQVAYDGLNVGIHSRFARFELQGFYTLSSARGNVLAGADEFRITDGNHQPDLGATGIAGVSVDPLDPLCHACFGPIDTDARHRVTLAGTYLAPWGLNVSGIFRYRSALPYTDYAGVDLNADGFLLDLPPGVSHVNSLRGASFSQLDLRLGKELSFGGGRSAEVIGEVFNLFNAKNPAGFVGNRTAANYRQATTFAGDPLQGEQRLAQLGLRIRF
jgi:hypothetical protein